jgi:hypothetical protein
VLVLVPLFADVLLGDRTLYFRDIYNNHLPLKTLQAGQILAGETPLWNPGLSGGQPLLANLNLFTFHPSSLLFLLLDPVSAVNWTVFLQLLLAGCGSFLLARRLGWGEAGALFTAFAFTLSGYMLSLGNLLNMLNSAAWLPLTAWLFLGWRRQRSSLAGVGCVLALSIQLLGGDPGMVLATVLLLALLVFRRDAAAAAAEQSRVRDLVSVAGLTLASAGLCGLQILPFRELLQQTVRGWGFTLRGATFWSTHPLRLAELQLPAFFGEVNSTVAGALWGHRLFDDGYPLILSIYAGQAVLLFTVLALLRWRRDRDALLFGLLLVVGLLLSLGGHTPLYRLIYALPVAGGMRFPSRFMILVTLALALLAGKAFGRLAGGCLAGPAGERNASGFCLAAMGWALAAALAMAVTVRHGDWAVDLMARAAGMDSSVPALGEALSGLLGRGLLAQLFLLGSAALAWAALNGRLRGPAFAGFGLAILVADLCLFGAGVNFRTDRTFFSSVPPAAAAIRADAGRSGLLRLYREDKPQRFRIDPPAKEKEWICLWDRSLLSPPSGLLLGVGYDLGVTTDLLSPRSTAEAARRMYRGGLEQRQLMWNICAVDYVLGFHDPGLPGLHPVHRTSDFSTISMVSLRNDEALPRARLVPHGLPAGEGDELDLVFAEGFDPRQQVVLPENAVDPLPLPPATGGEAGPGNCRIVHDSPARVTVEVNPGRPGWLVLADSWFPGWEAAVDGQPRPVLRANGLHRAVRVAPGDRVVTFVYRPRSWRAGLLLTLATALALGVFFGLAILRHRGSGEVC